MELEPIKETPSQIQESSNTTVEQAVNSKKPRKLFKKIMLSLSIIFLIILISTGIGVYFLAKQLLPPSTSSTNSTQSQDAAKILNNPIVKKMIQTAPIPKVTMIPITVTVMPTTAQTNNQPTVTNWKTYQNTIYKFSINYPGNEAYQENNHGLGVIDIVFFDASQGSSTDSPDYQFLIFPKAIGSLIGQDFDQLYNLPSPSAQILKINNSSQQFTKLQNTTINGLRAFSFQSTAYPAAANEQAEDGDYLEMGDNILTISTGQSNQITLNAMMSSFKYTP